MGWWSRRGRRRRGRWDATPRRPDGGLTGVRAPRLLLPGGALGVGVARLFRLLKRGGSPWVLPEDVVELMWAVTETHKGLEFLRDSAEFRQAYVETVALRILWGLGGSGLQRITLQRWRRSTLPEVLFQLDDEGDINASDLVLAAEKALMMESAAHMRGVAAASEAALQTSGVRCFGAGSTPSQSTIMRVWASSSTPRCPRRG